MDNEYTQFQIVRNSNGEIHLPKVRKIDRIWFIGHILVCLLAAFIVNEPIELDIKPSGPQLVLISCDQLRLVLCLIFCAIIIAMDMWNRFKIVAVLRKITTFDREVRKKYNYGTQCHCFIN